MVEIIQTKVDEEKLKAIDKELLSISDSIEKLNNSKNTLINERENLFKLYFCGKEILYEEEIVYKSDYKKAYLLAIIMSSGKSDFKMHARVHRAMGDLTKETYHAEVDEHGVNWHTPEWFKFSEGRKSKYGLTYDEAKELSRTWLAEIIHKYGDKQ